MTDVRKKLLIVNDEIDIMKRFRRKLTEYGVDVICANSYIEALEKMEGHQFDVLLLDVVLPKLPGGDASDSVAIGASRATAIAFQQDNPGKPIILDSTYAKNKIKEFGLAGLSYVPDDMLFNVDARIDYILNALGIEKTANTPNAVKPDHADLAVESEHFKTVRKIRGSAQLFSPRDDNDAQHSR